MIHLSFDQIADILDVRHIYEESYVYGVSMDTRTIEPGNLFIALKGERVDGHDLLKDAKKAGASAALVSRSVESDIPIFLVADVLKALGQLAANWRNQFNIPIIGLTGSNGKTTTKNMIAAILQKACGDAPNLSLATKGNWNNQISLPLNVCRLGKEHQYAVFEMGMNHFGEISYLTHIVQPNVALITNALPSHLEGVGSLDGVAKAKGEIFEGLKKEGIAILNAESNYFKYWRTLIPDNKIMTFGINQIADVTVEKLNLHIQCAEFLMRTPNGDVEIHLPLLGQHNVMNALGACAACLAIGIDIKFIKAGLESVAPEAQRLQRKFSAIGTCILDDSYNANPASLAAAIDVLVLHQGVKILALGDMKELGKDEKQYHFEMGQYAKQAGVDYLLTVGELTYEADKGFGENAMHFDSKKALIAYIKPRLTKDACVLAKGSHFSMHMEEVVDGLL